MRKGGKFFVITALSIGVLFAGSPPVFAQRFIPTQRLVPINPNPEIAPGVRLQQFAYNTAVLGQAYSQIPPYLFGAKGQSNFRPNPQFFQPTFFNPNVAPTFNPVVIPGGVNIGGGFNPYAGNPYAGNPYAGKKAGS